MNKIWCDNLLKISKIYHNFLRKRVIIIDFCLTIEIFEDARKFFGTTNFLNMRDIKIV